MVMCEPVRTMSLRQKTHWCYGAPQTIPLSAGVAQVARAPRSYRGEHWFKSGLRHHLFACVAQLGKSTGLKNQGSFVQFEPQAPIYLSIVFYTSCTRSERIQQYQRACEISTIKMN